MCARCVSQQQQPSTEPDAPEECWIGFSQGSVMTMRHLIGEGVVELADGRRAWVELHVEEHDGEDFFTIGVGRGFDAVSSRVTPQQVLDGYDDVLQGLTAFWLRDVIRRHGPSITWREVLRHCR